MIDKLIDRPVTALRLRARPPLELAPDTFAAELTAPRSRGAGRWRVLRRLLASADLAAAALGGVIATAVAGLAAPQALAFAALTTIGWFVIAFVSNLYGAEDLRSWASGVQELPRTLLAALVLSWPLYGAARLLDAPHPLLGALLACLLTALLSPLARAGARAYTHRREPLKQRCIIVGSGQVAGQLVDRLKSQSQFGLVPFGIVDDEIHDIGSPELPTLGRLSDLEEILRVHQVDRVIIAFSRASHEQLLRAIRACRDRRVAVDVVPRLFEFLDGARALDQVGGLPLLSIGAPRLTRSARVAKRALDVLAASAALTALAPLLALVALAIKLESRGPVFFRQQRAGRGGRPFEVFKFRSMYRDADARKAEFGARNDNDDGVMFKIHDDPRVTRVGRVLRRYSLDELPQLWNVLRGEMSLVGPRPLILEESAALAERWHQRRLDLRPGLTGPWQVSGRSDIPFQDMVRFDYQYVAGWSLARDLEILLATVPAVVAARGAY
jgi:exopolysaccharide biosynthesis polyprenyl glycosylphosphotransferase